MDKWTNGHGVRCRGARDDVARNRAPALQVPPSQRGGLNGGRGMRSGEEEAEEERRGEGKLGPDGPFPSPLLLGFAFAFSPIDERSVSRLQDPELRQRAVRAAAVERLGGVLGEEAGFDVAG